jgi:hypothetical protein
VVSKKVPDKDRLRWSDEKGGSEGVCAMYVLAKALVDKCHSLRPELVWVDGEAQLPRNSRPRFSDDPELAGRRYSRSVFLFIVVSIGSNVSIFYPELAGMYRYGLLK